MAKFEGTLYVNEETRVGVVLGKLDTRGGVTKTSDTAIAAVISSDVGTLEMRVTEGLEPKLSVWVCPTRETNGVHKINRQIYEGTMAEFCRGVEKLVHIAARKVLEEAFDDTAD